MFRIWDLELEKIVLNNPNLKFYTKNYERAIIAQDYFIIHNINIEIYKIDIFTPNLTFFDEIILEKEYGNIVNIYTIDSYLYLICKNINLKVNLELMIKEVFSINENCQIYYIINNSLITCINEEENNIKEYPLVIILDTQRISIFHDKFNKRYYKFNNPYIFQNKIIEFKFFFTNKNIQNNNKELFLFVLCKNGLYLIKISELKEYNKILRTISNFNNWKLISFDHNTENQFEIKTFDFYYINENELNIVMINQKGEIYFKKIKKDNDSSLRNKSKDDNLFIDNDKIEIYEEFKINLYDEYYFDLLNQNMKDKDKEKEKNTLLDISISSIKIYINLLFLNYKNKLIIINTKNKNIIHIWDNFEEEKIISFITLSSIIKQKLFFLFILSQKNLYYSLINYDDIENCIMGPEYFKKDMNNKKENLYEKEKCAYSNCQLKSSKVCSTCKKAYYCDISHQKLHWKENHKYYCYGKVDNDNLEEVDLKSTSELWYSNRKTVIIYYKSNNKSMILKGLLTATKMIEQNSKIISIFIKTKNKFNQKEKEKENIINRYTIIEDYICNYLLLTYGFILLKEKIEAWRTISNLINELEYKLDFYKLIENLILNLTSSNNAELEKKLINFVKLFTTIGKIYYVLGEVEYLHKFMINFVSIIEKFASNKNIILAKTYFFLGNLYIELDKLSFSIKLYLEALKLLKEDDINLRISLNFNLGLIYFVIDDFNNSKEKFLTALNLKEEAKKETISEVTGNIYEILGEVHLEYKKYDLALGYLYKSIEIYTKINKDNYINDGEDNNYRNIFKIKIMIDYINQILGENTEAFRNGNFKITKFHKFNDNLNNDNLNGFSTRLSNYNSLLYNSQELLDMVLLFPSKNRFSKKNEEIYRSNKEFNQITEERKDEVEKFFSFIRKLNDKQIELLNNAQNINYNNPIYFSPEFKNELNNIQKIELANFGLVNLTKFNILKNPDGLIKEDNLNYDLLYPSDESNNISSLKNYFVSNKLINNWNNSSESISPFIKNFNLNNSNMNSNKKIITNINIKVKSNNNNLSNEEEYHSNNLHSNKIKNNTLIHKLNDKKVIKQISEEDESNYNNHISNNKYSNTSKTSNNTKAKRKLKDNKKKISAKDFSLEGFKNILLDHFDEMKIKDESMKNYINDIQLFKICRVLKDEELDYIINNPQVYFDYIENQNQIESIQDLESEDNKYIDITNNLKENTNDLYSNNNKRLNNEFEKVLSEDNENSLNDSKSY